MNKTLIGVLEGIVAIVVGVLVAIFGGQAVLDIYFGVLFLIAGVILMIFAITILAKTKLLNFVLVFLSFVGLVIGSFLLAKYYSVGYLVYTLVLLIIAAGGALIFHGVYAITKKLVFAGIGEIVVGAASITVGILYIFVPEFHVAFWIVVGVLVALYGVIILVTALLNKNNK